MNVRHLVAASLVVALAMLGVGATGASGGKAADTLTVWLQVDAQSGWPEVVDQAYEIKHRYVKKKYRTTWRKQYWADTMPIGTSSWWQQMDREQRGGRR